MASLGASCNFSTSSDLDLLFGEESELDTKLFGGRGLLPHIRLLGRPLLNLVISDSIMFRFSWESRLGLSRDNLVRTSEPNFSHKLSWIIPSSLCFIMSCCTSK